MHSQSSKGSRWPLSLHLEEFELGGKAIEQNSGHSANKNCQVQVRGPVPNRHTQDWSDAPPRFYDRGMKTLPLMLAIALSVVSCQAAEPPAQVNKQVNDMDWKPLTPEERRVIEQKGTERPFSGTYEHHSEHGIYLCKRCGHALYRSDSKFDSRCGWPSFDVEVPGTVLRHPDPDGERTEIVCAHCGAHLGHVFLGEGFTERNTRHCVNSISLEFVPSPDTAYFAGGCFWGVEHHFRKLPGVLSTEVGYTGGDLPHPTYEQVCTGTTGHLEAARIIYDPVLITYRDLLQLFFEIHDFTQTDGQGPDIGPQYLSAVFVQGDYQRREAAAVIAQLEKRHYRVATAIRSRAPWYAAENYHQDYYAKTGKQPYCHIRKKIFDK